jgi:ribosome-associated protein
MTDNPKTLTAVIAQAAADRKALNLVGLDTRAVTSFAHEFLIATGTSNRHVRAVADAVVEDAKEFGRSPLGKEGYDEGRWVLIDFGDVIVHIFQEEVREYYDLERLWSEAPALDFADMGVVLPDESSADGPSHGVPKSTRAN